MNATLSIKLIYLVFFIRSVSSVRLPKVPFRRWTMLTEEGTPFSLSWDQIIKVLSFYEEHVVTTNISTIYLMTIK